MAEQEKVLCPLVAQHRSRAAEATREHWFSFLQALSTFCLAVMIVTCMRWTKATCQHTCATCSFLARVSPCRAAAATAATSAHELPKTIKVGDPPCCFIFVGGMHHTPADSKKLPSRSFTHRWRRCYRSTFVCVGICRVPRGWQALPTLAELSKSHGTPRVSPSSGNNPMELCTIRGLHIPLKRAAVVPRVVGAVE